MIVGKGKLDFLESKYKEKHPTKVYNFIKYTSNAIQGDQIEEQKDSITFSGKLRSFLNPKFIPGEFDENDPIQYNTTDMKYFFENDDAISFNLSNDNNQNSEDENNNNV